MTASCTGGPEANDCVPTRDRETGHSQAMAGACDVAAAQSAGPRSRGRGKDLPWRLRGTSL